MKLPRDIERKALAAAAATAGVDPAAISVVFAPPPYDLPEKEFTKLVIAYAQSRNYLVAHFRAALTASGNWVTAVAGDGVGWPDLCCVRADPPRTIWLELKSDSGRLSPEQRRWRDRLRAAGQEWRLVRPCDWAELVGVLG